MTRSAVIGSLLLLSAGGSSPAQVAAPVEVKHFIFFSHERERITEPSFVNHPNIVGAQLKYTWRELEPERDRYDFSAVLKDAATLEKYGKKLWIQLQDVSFSERQIIPDYLLGDPAFNGGAAREYDENGKFSGWVARRWDPAVRARLSKLLDALGDSLDGRIEGINLAETAITVPDPKLHPAGFTYDGYAAAMKDIITAAKNAFPRSHVIIYGNFMPGEALPANDRGYLRGIYAHAANVGAGVGGPDILLHRPFQQKHSLGLIRERGPNVIAGMAVQDGNLADMNKTTRQRVTVDEIYQYAVDTLRLNYIFWGTEEPYYSAEVLPFLLTNRQP
jgi:hypothetical protein